MAKLIPSLEEISKFKVQPEEGELYLLSFLAQHLDDSFEVYFNPYMNGDRPDIVVVRKDYGVLIIEVKDWHLDSYEVSEKKHWRLKSNDARVKSPIDQVMKYKENIYDLHISNLLEKKIKNVKMFSMVACAVYFHNASSDQIKEKLIYPFWDDQKYSNFLKYNVDLLGRDDITENKIHRLLSRRYLISKQTSKLFNKELYDSLSRFLKPPHHLREMGEDISYSEKQRGIIYEDERKQQRIKGVMGSGKTTVLAARAVQAYKRAFVENPQTKVLILTYNITLKNFIHDKISRVRENFSWDAFVILNYHQFINIELNNMGVPFDIPKELSSRERSDYLERYYYSNKQLFLDNIKSIKQYDVILIDEIQDYKRPWMEIIKDCFLAPDGEYLLFGDVKQNIYNNTIEGRDVSTNVRGVTELKRCFRSDHLIKELAVQFQKEIFKDKYEIDTFNLPSQQMLLSFDTEKEGIVRYIHLSDTSVLSALYTIIHENAINQGIPPNDITVLGYSHTLLKNFDAYYRYRSGEKTATMFESIEIAYRSTLGSILSEVTPSASWVEEGIKLFKRESDKNADDFLNIMSVMLTIFDMYTDAPDFF